MGRKRVAAYLAGLVAAAAVGVGTMGPASAAISNASLTLDSSQKAATGVTYQLVYTVGVDTMSSIVSLPSGVSGLSAGNVIVELNTGSGWTPTTPASLPVSTNDLALGVNFPSLVTTGTQVRITVSGLTNPTTSSVSVDVGDDTSLTPVDTALLDSLVSTALSLVSDEVTTVTATLTDAVSSGTLTSVSVAPVLTVTWNAASHAVTVVPDADGATTTSMSDSVAVLTNASSYDVEATLDGPGLVRSGTDGTNPADRIQLDYTVNDGTSDVKSGQFSTGGTYGSLLPAARSGPTGNSGQGFTVTYSANVGLDKHAGTYTGTLTYLVVPTF